MTEKLYDLYFAEDYPKFAIRAIKCLNLIVFSIAILNILNKWVSK